LIACNRTPSNSFKLEGFVEGTKDSENMILYYYILKNGEWYEIADTTKIINGKFLFEGNIDELTAASLCFDDSNSNVIIDTRIYLEPTTMKLRINKNQPYVYELSGTKVEKENIELRKELESDEEIFYKNLEYLNEIIKQIKLNNNNIIVRDSLFNNFNQYNAECNIGNKINKKRLDFIQRHNTYRIVPDLLYLLTKSDSIPIDVIKHIYNNLPEQSKNSLMGTFARKQIEYQESVQKSKENSLIGCIAPDFIRKDASGKTVRLSDFKNKNFVLLDFWASWCSPCIEEIPKVKNLYNKYGKKGSVIISISLDTDSANWLNAIDKYKLETWSQILSIQKRGESVFNNDDLCNLYNVERIPYFILIDKQGIIMTRWEYLGKEQLIELDRILTNMQK